MKEHQIFCNILDYGAIPGGEASCTDAFKAAVKACATAGGGTVHVPAGLFRSGPIHLENNITLHVSAGARIIFSQDPADFPIVDSRWEGVERQVYSPLIYGKGLTNVAVTGRGVLDGRGQPWWKLYREGTLEYPRPRFICFEESYNVLIEGITLVDSPAWTLNPIACENLTVNKVTIINPADSPNTDGINPDSCKNIHISNCHVDVGDDCVTLKSGTEESSRRIPCENITITNCTMVHGHGGVVIGSEMSGGVRNVTISNCVFEGTDRGIRVKTRRGRGGMVEDIRVTNIVMKDVICPLIMHQYYFCGPGGKEPIVWDKNPHPVTATTPNFRRIHLSNITARGIKSAAIFLYGLPEQPISELTFDNVSLELAKGAEPVPPAMMTGLEPMAERGLVAWNVKNVSFNNVTISGHQGPAFQINDASNLEFSRCASGAASEAPVIRLENTQDVFIHGCRPEAGSEPFLELAGTENRQIELAANSSKLNAERIRCSAGATKDAVTIR